MSDELGAGKDVVDKVVGLISAYTGVPADQIEPEMLLQEDLGLDSIDALEMLVALEHETGRHIEGEALAEVSTVNDVIVRARELVADEAGP